MEKFAAGVADTGGKFATGVIDTGGAPWLTNISANFRKNSKRFKWNTLGLGGNCYMKKTRSKKSRDTVPLKVLFNGKKGGVMIGVQKRQKEKDYLAGKNS